MSEEAGQDQETGQQKDRIDSEQTQQAPAESQPDTILEESNEPEAQDTVRTASASSKVSARVEDPQQGEVLTEEAAEDAVNEPAVPEDGQPQEEQVSQVEPSGEEQRPPSGQQTVPGSAKSSQKEPESDEVAEPAKPKSNILLKLAPDGVLPKGCVPIFLSGPSQEIFHLKADESVTASDPVKLITKESILADFYNRAGVSDFSVQKNVINNYPASELMIIYDGDFQFGENFVLITTEEAKESIVLLLKEEEAEQKGEEGEEAEVDEEGEMEPEVIHHYVPPESKPWVNLGSDKEILESQVSYARSIMRSVYKRKRREFGSPATFTDRDASAKSVAVEIGSYEDKSFSIPLMEMDKNISHEPSLNTIGTNTPWKYPVSAYTQYQPRELPSEERDALLRTEVMSQSMLKCLPYFVESLQQNEISNIFIDDYANLDLGDSTFESRADTSLKEFQSFTDLQFSKDKAVTCVAWHPVIKSVIAMSVAEKMTFDQRVENLSRVILTPSYIIFWSFTDPIQPQLLLEAPDDIYCFQFNPSDPHIIAGGCVSGQVVLWDTAKYMDQLKNVKAKLKTKSSAPTLNFGDDQGIKIPIMRFCAVSNVDASHSAPITDIQWMPDHYEVNRMGYSLENLSLKSCQLMSCAIDNEVLFWDTRSNKTPLAADKTHDAIPPAMGVPDTFYAIDMKWKPFLRVHLFKSEPGGDHAPTKFSIREVQGNRSVIQTATDDKTGDFSSAGYRTTVTGHGEKPGSGKARTLQGVNTHLYVGTEDGELVYVDWMPQKDSDTGKLHTTKPDFYTSLHDGPVVTLARSPSDASVLLVVGGWLWTVWKEGINSGPIISSCRSEKPLTGGAWSPTRFSLFYITRADGSVEIWDLLDKTHEPTAVQSLSSAALTSIMLWNFTNQQLLSIGDLNGTLQVFLVPPRLRSFTASELSDWTNYLDKEVRRREFVVGRWNLREQEKIEKEMEAKRKAGIAPQVILTEEEIIMRLKAEYDQYLEEEQAFLRELGLKEEDDEVRK